MDLHDEKVGHYLTINCTVGPSFSFDQGPASRKFRSSDVNKRQNDPPEKDKLQWSESKKGFN